MAGAAVATRAAARALALREHLHRLGVDSSGPLQTRGREGEGAGPPGGEGEGEGEVPCFTPVKTHARARVLYTIATESCSPCVFGDRPRVE